ncbi:hypothetical protein [Pontibacillus halophilus]|uniref:hypothetical protein n=1 Tax=Pontibacillus halophilus TaxID=516704 RepID=UPI0004169657|nr:hypothetical protein [Pontibacillus halophilus]
MNEIEFDFHEFIGMLERNNAIKYLPQLERDILTYVEAVELTIAEGASNIEEYYYEVDRCSPIQRTANHYGLTENECASILKQACKRLDELLES